MTELRQVVRAVSAFCLFIALDAVYVGLFASQAFGRMLKQPGGAVVVSWSAALAVYALLATFVVWLLDKVPFSGNELGYVLTGMTVYGIYDLTNLATLPFWSWQFALVDTAWGAFAVTTVSAIVSRVPVHG